MEQQQDWKDKSLDKDIILLGNKTYGPDVCTFVTHRVNNLFNEWKDRRLPKGVQINAKGVYYATVAYHEDFKYEKGRSIVCKSVREASTLWLEHKERTVIEVCTTLIDSRVIKGLMLHMELLKKESLRRVEVIEANIT